MLTNSAPFAMQVFKAPDHVKFPRIRLYVLFAYSKVSGTGYISDALMTCLDVSVINSKKINFFLNGQLEHSGTNNESKTMLKNKSKDCKLLYFRKHGKQNS